MEFPPNHRAIVIEAYNPAWPIMFEQEREIIQEACVEIEINIEHIGSTAVPGLAAKPTIDMMLSVAEEADANRCIEKMGVIGYCHLPGFFWKLPGRFDLVFKDNKGNRAFNIHIVEADSMFAERHLPFRDYLRTHADARHEYEMLKRNLAQQFLTDMDAYSTAKNDFVARILQQAQPKQS